MKMQNEKCKMKNAWLRRAVAWLLILHSSFFILHSASATATVKFDLVNFTASSVTNRKVIIQPLTAPANQGGQVMIGDTALYTATNGIFYVSNMIARQYKVELQSPPRTTVIYIEVTNSSSLLDAGTLLIANPGDTPSYYTKEQQDALAASLTNLVSQTEWPGSAITSSISPAYITGAADIAFAVDTVRSGTGALILLGETDEGVVSDLFTGNGSGLTNSEGSTFLGTNNPNANIITFGRKVIIGPDGRSTAQILTNNVSIFDPGGSTVVDMDLNGNNPFVEVYKDPGYALARLWSTNLQFSVAGTVLAEVGPNGFVGNGAGLTNVRSSYSNSTGLPGVIANGGVGTNTLNVTNRYGANSIGVTNLNGLPYRWSLLTNGQLTLPGYYGSGAFSPVLDGSGFGNWPGIRFLETNGNTMSSIDCYLDHGYYANKPKSELRFYTKGNMAFVLAGEFGENIYQIGLGGDYGLFAKVQYDDDFDNAPPRANGYNSGTNFTGILTNAGTTNMGISGQLTLACREATNGLTYAHHYAYPGIVGVNLQKWQGTSGPNPGNQVPYGGLVFLSRAAIPGHAGSGVPYDFSASAAVASMFMEGTNGLHVFGPLDAWGVISGNGSGLTNLNAGNVSGSGNAISNTPYVLMGSLNINTLNGTTYARLAEYNANTDTENNTKAALPDAATFMGFSINLAAAEGAGTNVTVSLRTNGATATSLTLLGGQTRTNVSGLAIPIASGSLVNFSVTTTASSSDVNLFISSRLR